MLCGNYYFIQCHVLPLFQTENFKPCSALQKKSVRKPLLKTVLSLLRTWWQIPNTQNDMHREEKKQARSLNQGLKSTVDACFTSQTGKSTVSAEWANMLQANNLGQESSEMVCFKPTKIKTGLLHYFAKHRGISWFSAISWKVQTQRMNIRLNY